MDERRAEDLLGFWMAGEDTKAIVGRWFGKDPEFDEGLRQTFGADLERALAGELEAWVAFPGATARSALAYVVLLDQLPRNIFRGTARSFAGDGKALQAALRVVDLGLELAWLERYLVYLPTMHAEDRGVQARGVELYAQLLHEAEAAGADTALVGVLRAAHDYALRHQRIIERFGRFPHRNALLGRSSSAEELAFLEEPGSSF